jgi:hypothetical protein
VFSKKRKTSLYISLDFPSSASSETPSLFIRSLTLAFPSVGFAAVSTAVTRSRPSGHLCASKRNSVASVAMITSFHCDIMNRMINNSGGRMKANILRLHEKKFEILSYLIFSRPLELS